MKLLTYDGPLYQICLWIYRFLLMSVLLLVGSIPIVTAPASIAATFGVARRLVRGDDAAMLSAFRTLFAENFIQSTVCGWILLAVAALLAVDYHVVNTAQTTGNMLIRTGLWLASVLWVCVWFNLFPLMVHMRTTNRALLRSALMLSFYKPYLTLINVIAVILLLKIFAYFPLLLFLLFPGAAAYLSYWIADRKFKALHKPSTATTATSTATTETLNR